MDLNSATTLHYFRNLFRLPVAMATVYTACRLFVLVAYRAPSSCCSYSGRSTGAPLPREVSSGHEQVALGKRETWWGWISALAAGSGWIPNSFGSFIC